MAGGYSREIWYKRLINMKILLDTHVLVWALSSPEKIKPKVQDLLVDTDNIVFVSIASLWELQIKKSLNKN